MPYHIERRLEGHLLLCRLTGAVTGAEVRAALAALAVDLCDPDGSGETGGPVEPDGRLNVVVDASNIGTLAIAPCELDPLAERCRRVARSYPQGRTGIVWARPMVRDIAELLLLKTKASPRERRLFRDLAPALAWVVAPRAEKPAETEALGPVPEGPMSRDSVPEGRSGPNAPAEDGDEASPPSLSPPPSHPVHSHPSHARRPPSGDS